MDYISQTLSNVVSGVSQSRPFQWSINKVRANVYPFVYNHNAWEANLILEEQNVWLGGLVSACDRSALKAHGITRIISAVYDIDPIFPDDPDLIYLKIPVLDNPTEEIAAHFDKAIDFIDESVDYGHGVLIHCVYGVSRSSTLMCAYLMRKHMLPMKQAVDYVKQRRPQVNPNSGFLLQLQSFGSPFVRTPARNKPRPGSNPSSRGCSPQEGFSMVPLFPPEIDTDEYHDQKYNHNEPRNPSDDFPFH